MIKTYLICERCEVTAEINGRCPVGWKEDHPTRGDYCPRCASELKYLEKKRDELWDTTFRNFMRAGRPKEDL